jgi:hypothetical protein
MNTDNFTLRCKNRAEISGYIIFQPRESCERRWNLIRAADRDNHWTGPAAGEDDLVWFPSLASRSLFSVPRSNNINTACFSPWRHLSLARRLPGQSWRQGRRPTRRGSDGGRLQRRPRGAAASGGGVRTAAADRVRGILAGVFGAAPGSGHGGGSEGDRHGAAQQQAPREPALRGRHPSPHPPPQYHCPPRFHEGNCSRLVGLFDVLRDPLCDCCGSVRFWMLMGSVCKHWEHGIEDLLW